MKFMTMRVEELMPDPKNPRKHDSENLDAIRSSLAQHGQVEPLVVQLSTGMVIAGNGRLQAMKSLDWDTCRVVGLEVDDEEARALSIRLNRTAELAGWDEDALSDHLTELAAFSRYDVVDFGFDDEELGALIEGFASEIKEMEAEIEQQDEEIAEEQEAAPATTDDELSEHVQPKDMKASKRKEIRLYLSPELEQTFQLQIRALAQAYGLDNITDTIVVAVRRQHTALAHGDERSLFLDSKTEAMALPRMPVRTRRTSFTIDRPSTSPPKLHWTSTRAPSMTTSPTVALNTCRSSVI